MSRDILRADSGFRFAIGAACFAFFEVLGFTFCEFVGIGFVFPWEVGRGSCALLLRRLDLLTGTTEVASFSEECLFRDAEIRFRVKADLGADFNNPNSRSLASLRAMLAFRKARYAFSSSVSLAASVVAASALAMADYNFDGTNLRIGFIQEVPVRNAFLDEDVGSSSLLAFRLGGAPPAVPSLI